MSNCCGVDFIIEDVQEILFSLGDEEALGLELADPLIKSSVYPEYDGPVAVVSRIGEDQTLPTALTTVMEDITVERIPVWEVSNPAGGLTVTIGRND